MKKRTSGNSYNYQYEYTQTNNHSILFGRIDYISPIKTASNNCCYSIIKLFEFSEQKDFYVFVWDQECKKVHEYGLGTVVKVNAYIRSYKDDVTGKVKHCLKAFDVTKTYPYYTIFGTIGTTDAHIKRGKGRKAFSFKPDINGDTTMMYGVLDNGNALWNKIQKGKYVQIMGKFNLSEDKQTVTLDVLGVTEQDANKKVNSTK